MVQLKESVKNVVFNSLLFQYLMVQLKVSTKPGELHPIWISIPHGTIKRKDAVNEWNNAFEFQYLMVQLKELYKL